jgi:3-isopropylmalate/(R)-2-methylmalate dehydratase small subunit
MSSEAARAVVTGRAVPVAGDDIDTDRIIPARFMKTISFEELGRFAFHDERYDDKGKAREHPFNDPRFRGARVLLTNRNFGCGSSREHAPQSLMRYGIRGLIGESFAEIFSGNCTAMGLPAVRVSHDHAERLMERVRRNPGSELRIDLEAKTVSIRDGEAGRVPGESSSVGSVPAETFAEETFPEETFPFEMPEGDRQSLMSGDWDTTSVLLANSEEIRSTAGRLPYINGFAAG